jgi:hypothetical protein
MRPRTIEYNPSEIETYVAKIKEAVSKYGELLNG